MPTPTKGHRLGGSPAHQRLLLANLATSLFEHGKITTTEAKAKRLRPLAERLITFAKRGDLHARRRVLAVVRDKDVVHRLFAEIGPSYAERAGGYTRIIKTIPRKGDNAAMAVIELVEARTIAQEAVGEAERARRTPIARRRRPTGATREAAEELAAESPTAAAVAAEAAADDSEVAHVDSPERTTGETPSAAPAEDSADGPTEGDSSSGTDNSAPSGTDTSARSGTDGDTEQRDQQS